MEKEKSIYLRYVLLVVCCMCTMIMAAQDQAATGLSSIRPGSKINCIMDFSQCTIMGMTETEFAEYERDWYKDKPTIVRNFQKGFNNRLGGVLNIGAYPDANYTLTVKAKLITEVGNLYCDAVITDQEGTTLLHVKNVNGGSEPPFLPGTKLAKMKIWSRLTGRSLGSIVRSEYLAE